MAAFPFRRALIVGAGLGISASVARLLTNEGVKVALACRRPEKLSALSAEIGAELFTVDATDQASVERLFNDVDARIGPPDVVVFNASQRASGKIVDLDPQTVKSAIDVTAYAGFLVAQQAARRMLPEQTGALLFTGATASVKGFAHSAAFAMGKFALRGLSQSLARELGPQGIHVAHIIVDGGVRSAQRPDPTDHPDSTLDPDAIAENYISLLKQSRSAWTHEIDVRPWVERF